MVVGLRVGGQRGARRRAGSGRLPWLTRPARSRRRVLAVALAQLAEQRNVDPQVRGSRPLGHPTNSLARSLAVPPGRRWTALPAPVLAHAPSGALTPGFPGASPSLAQPRRTKSGSAANRHAPVGEVGTRLARRRTPPPAGWPADHPAVSGASQRRRRRSARRLR